MTILEEYQRQDIWRDWQNMIHQLPIEDNQTILDLGCGPGLVSARLASLCKRVIGIDRNPSFLETARQYCQSNCEFHNADLTNLDASNYSHMNGLWSSFTAAYFPTFKPVLERWASCIKHDGWLAIIEIDDLFTGHHPLPDETKNAFREFMSYAQLNNHYDFCMGRRLKETCHAAGLTIVSECSFKDLELAFDGAASPEILTAWRQRFMRMRGMKKFLGIKRFNHITDSFLEAISSEDHCSSAKIVMVIARVPKK